MVKVSKNKILFLTLIFVFVYTISAIIVSVIRYWQFEGGYFDFGIADQAIWSVSRFKAPIVYHQNFEYGFGLSLADHFSPSVYLLAPLYWITQRQEIILIFQSIVVGLSALVGIVISRKFIKNSLVTFALIFSYLGFVGMQNALITEFHEATIATLPIFIALWAIVNRKWAVYYLFLFLILGLKETFAGLGVGIGIFMFLYDKKNFKHALVTVAICLSWAFLATKIIIPTLSGRTYFYAPGNALSNFFTMIASFTHFDLRLKTLFYSFLSFGFLPALNPSLLPAIFENFLSRFLTDSGSTRHTLALHYSAPLAPLMLFSGILVMSKLEKIKRFKKIIIPYSIFLIVNTFVLHQFILRGPLALSYNKVFYTQTKNNKYVEDFIKNIPKDRGLIMTQNNIAGRLSHYKVMVLDRNYPYYNPSYIALNLTDGQNPNNFFPLSYEDSATLKERLLIDPNYKLKKYADQLYLFTRIK